MNHRADPGFSSAPPAGHRSKQPFPWFVPLAYRPQARLRLYCFPQAGGGAAAFRAWPGLLPQSVEPHVLVLPGREHRLDEPAATDLGEVAEILAGELVTNPDPRPFVFFGHSAGCWGALELARALRRAKGPLPLRLGMSAGAPPDSPDFSANVREIIGTDPAELLRRIGGKPAVVLEDPAARAAVLAALENDGLLYLWNDYPLEPPLDCPISTFRGVEDPFFSAKTTAGWRYQSTAETVSHSYPGGHSYIQERKADVIRDLLNDIGFEKP